MLLAPVTMKSETILQRVDDGSYQMIPTEDLFGLKTRLLNHRTFLGMLRKGIEQAHAGIKMDKILSYRIDIRHLCEIGERLCKLAG